MSATAERVLEVGDIIEIAQYDELCRLNLRRVRVKAMVPHAKSGGHQIIGVNMQGKNPMDYVLPAAPFTELKRVANTTIWTFTETTLGEE